MKTVKVYTSDLLQELDKNKAKHQKTYEAALEGYWLEIEKQIKKARAAISKVNKAKDNKDLAFFARYDGVTQLFTGWNVSLYVEPPENHTDDYDRAIGMVKMHVDETVLLDLAEYKQYIEDDWAWTGKFAQTSSMYLENIKK